jgi:hypothetical protein
MIDIAGVRHLRRELKKARAVCFPRLRGREESRKPLPELLRQGFCRRLRFLPVSNIFARRLDNPARVWYFKYDI